MSDRPLSERVLLAHSVACRRGDDCDCGAKDDRAEIIALEAERDRLKRVAYAAHWTCPKCTRIVGREQETCRCGFDRAALEGGDG